MLKTFIIALSVLANIFFVTVWVMRPTCDAAIELAERKAAIKAGAVKMEECHDIMLGERWW